MVGGYNSLGEEFADRWHGGWLAGLPENAMQMKRWKNGQKGWWKAVVARAALLGFSHRGEKFTRKSYEEYVV